MSKESVYFPYKAISFLVSLHILFSMRNEYVGVTVLFDRQVATFKRILLRRSSR